MINLVIDFNKIVYFLHNKLTFDFFNIILNVGKGTYYENQVYYKII